MIISKETIDAVVFDLDGSLVDSMWIWKSIDEEYLNRFGISIPDGLQNAIEGASFHETAIYFKEHFKIADSLEKIKEDWNEMAYEKYAHEIPMKEGGRELISYCLAHDIKMGVATSNSRELVDVLLASLEITDCFQVIVTGSEITNGKPKPDIYLKAAEGLSVSPERCLAFEDIIAGIQAAKAAGMKVCAVWDEYSVHQNTEKKKLSDMMIHDFRDLEYAD